MPLDPEHLIQATATLGAVLLLAWGAARLVRRSPLAASPARPRTHAQRRLRIEESVAIDPRRRLILLSCDGRDLLILTGGGMAETSLGWVPPPAVAPQIDSPSPPPDAASPAISLPTPGQRGLVPAARGVSGAAAA